MSQQITLTKDSRTLVIETVRVTAAVSLQDAYNIDASIITSAAKGPVSIKRGSALYSDDILEFLDGADVKVASLTGVGYLSVIGLVLVGHTVDDILISIDGASVLDSALAPAVRIDANAGDGGILVTAYHVV